MIDRTKPPVPKNEISYSPPGFTETKLNNGVPVFYTEKNSLPIVQINVIVNTGSASDPANKQGLTNLLAVTIDEGANGFSSLEIDNKLEALGTLFSISVEPENTFFTMMTLKKNLEKSLEILSWILQKPNFTEEDFNREKNRILDEVKRLKDSPAFIADYFLTKNLFKGTPFSYLNLGASETLKNISLSDIKNHYKKYFSSKNLSVVAVGNLSEEEFSAAMNKHFTEFNADYKSVPFEVSLQNHKRHFHLVNKPGAAQSEIRIANLATGRHSPDFFGKKLANSILGGQFSSRLNHNLREEKGITYGVSTFFKYTKEFGSFNASTAVDSANTVLAVKEFYKEFDLIRQEISEEEIAFSKSYARKLFPLQFASYSKIATNNTNLVVFDLSEDFYKTYIEELETVTKDEILRSAQTNILPEAQQVVIVGDVNSFIDELTEFAGEDSISRYELEEIEI